MAIFQQKEHKIIYSMFVQRGSSKGYCYMGTCHNAARWTEVFKVNVG